MAASGLDHLKNDYRRRFCRPSRALDINTEQGQNILEILQDCFEEQSFANDLSTNSTKSIFYSTPKIKDICNQLPSKEGQYQKSHPNSVLVSSKGKDASVDHNGETSKASKSVCTHDVHVKNLATDVGLKNTPDTRKMLNANKKIHHDEDKVEFYLSVGSPSALLDAKTVSQNVSAQRKETCTFENSVNLLSSSTEISLKTKKRLDFEDKDVLKNVETENKISKIEDKMSEGLQKGKRSGTSQKRIQDSEYEIQPQAKKSFSTLFLETVNKKSASSPIVQHTSVFPPHPSPANDKKLLEDEFVIDKSDTSFADRSWISIPRRAGSLKQCTGFPIESTTLIQNKKSREKHHSVSSVTLTKDKDSDKVQPIEKSQPTEHKKLGRSCALTDAMENDHGSTKCETYSENAKQSPQSTRTRRQKQRRKSKPNVVEDHVDTEQSKEKNQNVSHPTQDNLQRNSDRNIEVCEEIRNAHTSVEQMQPGGSQHNSTHIPLTKNQKRDRKSKKKHSSHGSKKNKLTTKESDSTLTRSRRISRRPSDWWVVKPEQSPAYSYSSIVNESAHHNSRRKPAEKTSQSSKNSGEKTNPPKRQKRTQGRARELKFLSTEDPGEIVNHDEISTCSHNDSLEIDKADLAEKKNFDHSGCTGSSKERDGTNTIQNVHLKSQPSDYTCKTVAESNLDFGEPKNSVFEGSGPSTVKNFLITEKNNSDVDDKEVQENPDDSRLKGSQVTLENKIHHKLVMPSNTPNVRRTKRIRSKPLEYWRGERVDYQGRPSGGFVVGGILSPDTESSKRKTKENMEKVNKIVNKKRICLDNDKRNNKLMINLNIPLGDPLQPTRVKDPETREIILMDLIRPRDTYQFFVEHGDLKVYKTLDTPFFSTGKLTLGPHQEKGKQHVGADMLVFYVNFGDLLCTLHETSYVITTGDSFYVPSGNYYNIKNLLDKESVLLFTQIKR
ncbi:PREDICTED: centromere protein C [Condylura cristata]|uniref:centromere protein C n=1 Tax=Condylura cristata TaxID=143302 RepID=UPI000642F9C3|nr:PREDICTED: centromere protein C [Condylura cristata]